MRFAQVYQVVKAIPRGKVATYGRIARVLGEPGNARVVGWALHVNRNPEIPCHRVVSQSGCLADNFAHGGWQAQRDRLLAEGVELVRGERVNLKRCLFRFGRGLAE